MSEPPFWLNARCRTIVLDAIREVCSYRDWQLDAAHVRPNHVHSVIEAQISPEFILNTIKGYSTKHLKKASGISARKKYWARHGSTKYLWTVESLEGAIAYVVEGQGVPMSVYRRPPDITEPRL